MMNKNIPEIFQCPYKVCGSIKIILKDKKCLNSSKFI